MKLGRAKWRLHKNNNNNKQRKRSIGIKINYNNFRFPLHFCSFPLSCSFLSFTLPRFSRLIDFLEISSVWFLNSIEGFLQVTIGTAPIRLRRLFPLVLRQLLLSPRRSPSGKFLITALEFLIWMNKCDIPNLLRTYDDYSLSWFKFNFR